MLLSLGLIDGVEVLLETGTRTIPMFAQLVMSSKLPSSIFNLIDDYC